jgi:hypothetical protein
MTCAKASDCIQNRSPILFRCLLDEQPTDLLPKPALATLRTLRAAGDLVLNPYCQLSSRDLHRLPFLDRFLSAPETLWILDPATDALLPFWLGTNSLRLLGQTQPGHPPPEDIQPKFVSVLRFADLLVARNYRARRRQAVAQTVARAATSFQQNGFALLTSLVHPFHLAALRRYYRDLANAGAFHPGEGQYSKRSWMHNETVARFFHHQLTSIVAAITREAVRPSYVYIASYGRGADLPKHTDREQCEFTISMCLDFIPEPRDVTGWPLYLETKSRRVVIQQALGDGLLFRGREIPHYREPLPHASTSTSIFFHFVRCNFVGSLD